MTEVSDYTQFPEMMDGRVKTLRQGVLTYFRASRHGDEVMAQHQIDPIDMVVVNLYPFAQTVARADCTLEQQ